MLFFRPGLVVARIPPPTHIQNLLTGNKAFKQEKECFETWYNSLNLIPYVSNELGLVGPNNVTV